MIRDNLNYRSLNICINQETLTHPTFVYKLIYLKKAPEQNKKASFFKLQFPLPSFKTMYHYHSTR